MFNKFEFHFGSAEDAQAYGFASGFKFGVLAAIDGLPGIALHQVLKEHSTDYANGFLQGFNNTVKVK